MTLLPNKTLATLLWTGFLALNIPLSGMWTPTNDLSDPSDDASDLQFGIDSSNNVIAVFTQYFSPSIVQGAILPYGSTTWIPTSNLSDGTNDSTLPQIGVTPSGNAVAVWIENIAGDNTIMASTLAAGSLVWSTPAVPLSLAGVDADDVQIGIDAAGNAIAIWERGGLIEARFYDADADTWDPVETLSGVSSDTPQIAMAPNGNAVAVWESVVGADIRIQAATYDFGTATWSAASEISPATFNAENAQVSINASGDAIAGWILNDGTDDVVQVAFLPAGGAWSAETTLSDSGNDASAVQVAIDASGNAVAIWEWDEIIQASTYDGSWTPTTDLSILDPVNFPQIAMDSAGNAVAVWQELDSGDALIKTAILPAGSTTWIDTTTISQPGGQFPELILGTNNYAVAGWALFNPSLVNFIVQAAVNISVGEVTATSYQKTFATQTEFFTRIVWEPLNDDTINYLVYRNGNLIARVPAPASFYDDHNRPAGANTGYSVATTNNGGTTTAVPATPVNPA